MGRVDIELRITVAGKTSAETGFVRKSFNGPLSLRDAFAFMQAAWKALRANKRIAEELEP